MYEVAVFFHILGGFIWIGGLLYVQMFWHRIILSDSDDAARSRCNAVNWLANRVIVPAALVVLGGIASAGYRQAAQKLMRVGRVDGLVVVTILALMVFKPTL